MKQRIDLGSVNFSSQWPESTEPVVRSMSQEKQQHSGALR